MKFLFFTSTVQVFSIHSVWVSTECCCEKLQLQVSHEAEPELSEFMLELFLVSLLCAAHKNWENPRQNGRGPCSAAKIKEESFESWFSPILPGSIFGARPRKVDSRGANKSVRHFSTEPRWEFAQFLGFSFLLHTVRGNSLKSLQFGVARSNLTKHLRGMPEGPLFGALESSAVQLWKNGEDLGKKDEKFAQCKVFWRYAQHYEIKLEHIKFFCFYSYQFEL